MNKVPFQGKRKLQLLHGPATSASRKKLQDIKKSFSPDDIVVFDSEVDPGQVIANLMAVSMFSESRLVIWENPPEDFIFDASLITYHSSLVLWFDHEVAAKKPILVAIQELKGEVLFFSEAREISVFPFLDLLASSDKNAFLELEKLKNAGFDIQYFLTMTFYLLRNLVATPKNAPQFVRDKLQRQRTNFPREKIVDLYKDILEIDFKIKSGLLEKSQAEFLLVNKFLDG